MAENTQTKSKKCPYCLETINPGAVICRHCGSSLKIHKRKKKIPRWRTQYMLGLYSGVAIMVVLIYLFNRIF